MKLSSLLLPFALLSLVSTAPAAIVYSGVQNITVPQTFAGVYLNVVTQMTTFSQPPDFDTAPWLNLDFGGTGISNGDLLRPVSDGGSRVVRLPLATTIGSPSNLPPGANYSDMHAGPAADQFQLLTVGYMGYGFSSAPGNPLQYGWVRVTVNNAGTGTIHDWAYESTPTLSISAGAVPEPAATAFLLLGLAGFSLRRSRRA